MPPLLAAQNSNLAYCPSYVPVIVVFGGTSGIGEAMVKLLASNTKGRAHIIIIGRNQAAAETIIASLPKPSEADAADSRYEFLACDVTVMKNVHELADKLKAKVPKINFLVLSAGVFAFTGRKDTVDGIDFKLASRYYSRFAAIQDLLPLLKEAKARGEDAVAMSILGAGYKVKPNFDDLGLKKTYSGGGAMTQSIVYNDLMVEVRSSYFITSQSKLIGVFNRDSRNGNLISPLFTSTPDSLTPARSPSALTIWF